MAHQEKPIQPQLKIMPSEKKWDRVHDLFTFDHALSKKTHRRLGTLQAWGDDTVDEAK
jgi:hypothetical protein